MAKQPSPTLPKVHAKSIVNIPIADLLPYEANPRTHPEEQIDSLVTVIRDSGFTNPVLVDSEKRIIAGHGRMLAAARVGMKSVPCIVVEGLSEPQIRALRISDNKIALGSGWDEKLLRAELADLQAAGWDMATTGFSFGELKSLYGAGGGRTDPDSAPPLPPIPVSRLGDVWLLGDHRLVCGSCTEPATVAQALGGAKPNLMVTDPPYGVNYDPAWRRRDGVAGSGNAEGRVLNDDRMDWREAWVLFPGNVAYVWHGDLQTVEVWTSLHAASFQIRAPIIWRKQRAAISRGHYHWQHETAAYVVRDGATSDDWQDDGGGHAPGGAVGAPASPPAAGGPGSFALADPEALERFFVDHETAAYAVREGSSGAWVGGRKQSTVWEIEHVKNDTGHSTQKPVEAMARPMRNNSRPGDHVYEPFSGSGTSIIAAQIEGRLCHAIELNPGYVDVGVRRWSDYTGLEVFLESDGRAWSDVAAERLAENAPRG